MDSNGQEKQPGPGLWITGLGHQYPAHLFGPEALEDLVSSFYDVERPGLKQLMHVNRASGINERPCFEDISLSRAFLRRPEMPTITDMNAIWLEHGVELSAQACRKALEEWGGALSEITHLVACTSTCYGNPGVDLFVAEKLGLEPGVERVLLAGVGCAGGLAIMRVAAQLACGATVRQRSARILAFTCELCTTNARKELADAEASENPDDVCIAAALFSDGAAAFVLSNDAGFDESIPLFQVLDWDNATLPNTSHHMSWDPCPTGYNTILTRDVAKAAVGAVEAMFSKLLPSICERANFPHATAANFDWALHPGGKAIINGVQESMGLSDAQLASTKHIYKTRGNSSSPTALIVLDTMRKQTEGKENVVAVAFGPGMVIEMAFLRRCDPLNT